MDVTTHIWPCVIILRLGFTFLKSGLMGHPRFCLIKSEIKVESRVEKESSLNGSEGIEWSIGKKGYRRKIDEKFDTK